MQHPVTSITWGHNDKRIFVATGNHIHVGWVSPNIASLQLLSRLKIHKTLQYKDQVDTLPLPCRLQDLIAMLFTQTIRVTTYMIAMLIHIQNEIHCKQILLKSLWNLSFNIPPFTPHQKFVAFVLI